ncbi:uncharacterized protein LOC128963756 [Oppia nitens]|uniref:uncharacterized protein LOC128951448 n=1 Tax=Oppia nitens TaxID=1686743 RepID=UPI0023D9AAD9|nr:uncharacterized protein LOC128951448 [Oppia nitens]XP_054165713.1 uncharacterized protein LOC128963237 [Oppia nitens]XP_054166244.1 uncharacterized protein LOC128963756 [Oppia nitens]
MSFRKVELVTNDSDDDIDMDISSMSVDIKDWLKGELTYTLHKQVHRKFIRNPIVVTYIDEQWEADLADMREFANKNDKYNYILTVIDCFSKFAFTVPLKVKTGKSITNAFKTLFKNRKPLSLRTDKVERFNRTLKSRMFKYFTANGSRRYVDVLQKLVKAYNTSYHRSIDVATGDKVRKVYEMSKFDKGYYPNWTDQVFTVVKTIKGDNQYVFRLSDGQGNIIEQRFYPQEIQKIKENLYRIERVIRSRVRRGRRQYFVKWLNYPEEYNSWIDSIQDVYTK